LRQAGIAGAAGLTTGFLGTALTSRSLAMASAIAAIGFGLTGIAGATASSKAEPAVSYPFLVNVMSVSRESHGLSRPKPQES
jgi:hypothetical protein